jgi:hypothetical protein
MSLKKNKQAAKEALEILRSVACRLDHEQRPRYLAALEAVARYNGELRREKSTLATLADAATQPGETPREKLLRGEVSQLQKEIERLKADIMKPLPPISKLDILEAVAAMGLRNDVEALHELAARLVGCLAGMVLAFKAADLSIPFDDFGDVVSRNTESAILRVVRHFSPAVAEEMIRATGITDLAG